MTAGTNWIQEYWRQITTGEVTVGQWIRLLYERIINGLNDGTYAFDARAAVGPSISSKTSATTTRDAAIC